MHAPIDYSRVPLDQRGQPRDWRMTLLLMILWAVPGTPTNYRNRNKCARLRQTALSTLLRLDGKLPIMCIIYGLDTDDLRFTLEVGDINQGTVRLRHVPAVEWIRYWGQFPKSSSNAVRITVRCWDESHYTKVDSAPTLEWSTRCWTIRLARS